MHAGLSPCRHSAHKCRAAGHWHIDLRAGEQRSALFFSSLLPTPTHLLTVLKQFKSGKHKQTCGCLSVCIRCVFVSSFILKIPLLLSSFLPPFLPHLFRLSLAELIPSLAGAAHLHSYQSVWTIQQRLEEGRVINMLIALPHPFLSLPCL